MALSSERNGFWLINSASLPGNPSIQHTIIYYLAILSDQYNHIWVFLILGRTWFWLILALCSHLSVDVFYETCGSRVSGLRVVTDPLELWLMALCSVSGASVKTLCSAAWYTPVDLPQWHLSENLLALFSLRGKRETEEVRERACLAFRSCLHSPDPLPGGFSYLMLRMKTQAGLDARTDLCTLIRTGDDFTRDARQFTYLTLVESLLSAIHIRFDIFRRLKWLITILLRYLSCIL